MINFKVDEALCVQCELCAAICPTRCIESNVGEYPTIPEEERCLRCEHCLAICPTGAISILGVDPEDCIKLKDGFPSSKSLETLIKGRRSIRKYNPEALDPETIRYLVDTAWHAPTGANVQSVLFTVTMTAEKTDAFRKELYQRLHEMFSKLDPEKDDFSLSYLRRFNEAFEKHGIDTILHGAPHFVIVSAPQNIPLPVEDSIIALTTFELLAVTKNVGTVWNGMLTVCVKRFFPDMAEKLGIPKDHTIAFGMGFGRPDMVFQRTVKRGPALMNLVE